MIAEREVVELKPVEKAPTAPEEKPTIAVSLPQPVWSDKLLIASNICYLAGLLIMTIALLLPAGMLSTVLIAYPMSVTLSLALLIIEVSLFVLGAILFALGFIWPRIK
ncbi:MAG TPA: hypothetical protein VE843_00425 [Ktedonobacteraceae bacterium]|nr:hypothetical protein [Ktedonobacteraceae bacterium]